MMSETATNDSKHIDYDDCGKVKKTPFFMNDYWWEFCSQKLATSRWTEVGTADCILNFRYHLILDYFDKDILCGMFAKTGHERV